MKKIPIVLSLAVVFSLFILVKAADAAAIKTNAPAMGQKQELNEMQGDAIQKREESGETKGELLQKREEDDGTQILKDDKQKNITASQSAENNKNKVSDEVKTLLEMRDDKKGIGQKVREIAQEQVQSQEKVSAKLAKMEEKKIWLKKMFGYDREAVQSVQQEIEANRLRIEELQALKEQVTDKTEIDSLDEAISSLVEQNVSLQNTVQAEMKNQGVWGWFRGIFNRS